VANLDYEALIIAISVIAMMCPSVYTIAWSKKEKANYLPILYMGLGISGLTIFGALTNNRALTWFGIIVAFAFFLWVVFCYESD